MGRLLGAAAGSEEAAAGISAEARDGFTERLAELLPSGFAPEGSGPLKVLVIRPVTQWHPNVDRYLAGILRPRLERGATLEFRASETDSVTVVLLRTGMGLHELPETRSMLATLELARAQGRPQDLLAWRQRLGHLDDPSPAAPDRQRELLHRLLCCLWNGQVDVLDGSPDSPQRIRIRTGTHRDEDVPELELWLDRRLDGTSSWADLLTAYERWACAHPAPPGQAEIAHGLLTARPLPRGREVVPPDPLFLRVVGSLPPLQLARLDTLLTPGSPHLEPWACARWRFWAQLLPGALELHFDSERVGHDNLRSIMEVLGHALPFPAADGYDGHQRRPPWEEQRQGR
jgi:hypothetical protein